MRARPLRIIEFLDQVRDVLMRSYGDDVKAMLQEASPRAAQQKLREEDNDETF